MTLTSGSSITFVESSLPPRPTSKTTISHCCWAKCTSATAVMSSNSVGWSSMASAASLTCKVTRVRSSRDMHAPSTRMRSSNAKRYGLVNRPVLYPARRSMHSVYAQTDPFPFVPATCTNRSSSCGFPRRSNSSRVRSRPIRDSRHRGSLMYPTGSNSPMPYLLAVIAAYHTANRLRRASGFRDVPLGRHTKQMPARC